MNIEEIRALAEIMTKNGLTRVKIQEDEKTVCLEKQNASFSNVAVQVPESVQITPAVESPSQEKHPTVSGAKAVKSPMVGMFYDSPSPEAESYVKMGSKIKKGDVLCVIEAMKLLNEITADMDGEIVNICVKNGDIVEYGQTLFEIA